MRVATRLLVSLPAVLAPLRRLVAMLLPVVLAGGLLAGCGDDDSGSVTDLLDRAFQSSIGSADMTLEIEIELDGVDELDGPIEIKFTGPYDSTEKGQIPRVDWDITVQAQNQSFTANLTSTGDRAFVGFQGTDYEVSQATVDALNQQLAASEDREGSDLSDFGVTARDWIVDADEEGDEDVAGVETTHVSGKLDVTKVLEDLNTVVEEAAKLGGSVGQQAPPELTDEQKSQIEDVVNDPASTRTSARTTTRSVGCRPTSTSRSPTNRGTRSVASRAAVSRSRSSSRTSGRPTDRGAGRRAPDRRAHAATARPAGRRARRAGDRRWQHHEPAPQTDAEKQKAYEECVKTDPNDESVKAFCEVLLQ